MRVVQREGFGLIGLPRNVEKGMVMSNTEHYHNKGQEDAARGKYEPPHGMVEDLTTWSSDAMRKMAEENKAYDEGWRHAKDQKSS